MAAYLDLDVDDYDLNDDLLPCEFCEELFPMDLLIEHQSGCRADLVSYSTKKSHSEPPEDSAGKEKGENTPKQAYDPILAKIPSFKQKTKTFFQSGLRSDLVSYSAKKSHSEPPEDSAGKEELENMPKQAYDSILEKIPSFKQKTKKTFFQEDDNAGKFLLTKSTKKKDSYNELIHEQETITFPEKSLSVYHDYKPNTGEQFSLSDDDEIESIESFCRRAAIVLKKRLSSKTNTKCDKNTSDLQEKNRLNNEVFYNSKKNWE